MDTTTSGFNVSAHEEFDSDILVTNAVIGSSLAILTFCGQLLVFIIIYYDKRLQTPSNYYVISLASADLLIALISMPVWAIFSTLNYWPFSLLLCDIWNSLDHALCLISIHTIVFISIERYKSVSNPIKHRVFLTAKRMKICLGIIWIANWIFWCFYIFITEYLYGQIRDPRDCSASYLRSPIFAIGFGGLGVAFPVFVTAVVYIFIFRIARRAGVLKSKSITRNSKSLESFTNSAEITSETVVSTIAENLDPDFKKMDKEYKIASSANSSKGHKEDKERKALKTIALLLATFAICWLPLGIVFIIEGIVPGYLDITWKVAGAWLCYANSMLNPTCYAIGNPYFRESLSKLCCRYKCRKKG